MKNKKKADWLDWLLRIAIVLGIIGTFYFSYSPAKNYVTAKQEEAKIEEVSKKVVENTNDYPDVKEIKKSTNEDVGLEYQVLILMNQSYKLLIMIIT